MAARAARHRQGRAQRAGANPRFIVTNPANAPQELYERGDCARGDMENRIKECQLGLFSDRTRCQLWWPNQFRLLLAALAYVLMERLRTVGLAGTDLARAQVWTLRCRLLKIGAVIVRNTRRVRFFLASAFPLQECFLLAAQRFASGSPQFKCIPAMMACGGKGELCPRFTNSLKF